MDVRDLNSKIENHKKNLGAAHHMLVAACDEYRVALDRYLTAQRDLALAKAKGYLRADGTIDERKAKAVIAAEQAQTAADIAEVQKEASRDRKDIARSALENARSELSAIQSQ